MTRLPSNRSSTVAGIDLAAGSGATVAVALSFTEGEWPPLTLLHQQIAGTDDELLDFVSTTSPTVLAIDAPLTLPASVTTALAEQTMPPGISTGSPYTRAAERDSFWQVVGVRPFPVSFLGGLTFRAIVLAHHMRQRFPAMRIIEAFPSATFAVLGLRPQAQAAAGRRRKSAPEARRYIQQGLASYVNCLPEPDNTLMTADTLDAIGAGLAAYAFITDRYVAAGDASEGQIIVPDPNLFASAG